MKSLFVLTGALSAISLSAGCGDDTADPFVFDAGAKDAGTADAAKDGASAEDASPEGARDVRAVDEGASQAADGGWRPARIQPPSDGRGPQCPPSPVRYSRRGGESSIHPFGRSWRAISCSNSGNTGR